MSQKYVPRGSRLACRCCEAWGDSRREVAVQHPGGEDWEGFGRPSYHEDQSTRWLDFKPDVPVRPAVVAITKQGGGKIGI